MGKGIFITGTDTSVGKTIVTAGLGILLKNRGINIGIMKPIHTGCIEEKGKLFAPDTELLKTLLDLKEPSETITPYMFKMPVSPLVASEMEEREIITDKIISKYEKISRDHELTLVEGIGGIAVPVKKGQLISDIIRILKLPIIIVTRPYLGTINHTLLTIRFAEINNIKIAGIIVNYSESKTMDISEKTNVQVIEKISGIPILGIIPLIKDIQIKDPIDDFKNIQKEMYYKNLIDTFSENINTELLTKIIKGYN